MYSSMKYVPIPLAPCSWLTPLKELLEGVSEKFSEFFTEMRCVGQVKLLENEVS